MQAETKHIMSALPVVASILGDSLGMKVSIGEHSTAWTDGTSIFLPKLSVEGDATELGLGRGYISHEAGHIDTRILSICGQKHSQHWNSVSSTILKITGSSSVWQNVIPAVARTFSG